MRSPLEIKGSEAVTGAAVGYKTHSGPAVHSCQGGVTEGEEFGVDDREHGLAASVTVTEGELQQIPQALWEGDGRQQAELCWAAVVDAVQRPHSQLLQGNNMFCL